MLSLLSVSGIALLTCLLAVLLKKDAPTQGFLLVIGGIVLLFSMASMEKIWQNFAQFLALLNGQTVYFTAVLRAVGIAVVCRIVGSLCKDAGQSALAASLEVLGVLATLLVCQPLFDALLALVQQLS